MKKVFLSLATVAFVAAGSLTVTSCGGDDSVAPGPGPGPGPGPDPDPELTENFLKHDGEQFKLDGAEYSLETNADGVEMIYTLQGREGYYVSYSTYFWKGDIDNAQTVADLDAFGSVGYYVQLQDVELNAEGLIVDYTMPLPNEASELLVATAGAATNGASVGQASAASINVNTFTASQGAGTSNFDGSITAGSGVTFDWNGAITFVAVEAEAKAKGFAEFSKGLNQSVKIESNVKNAVKSSKLIK